MATDFQQKGREKGLGRHVFPMMHTIAVGGIASLGSVLLVLLVLLVPLMLFGEDTAPSSGFFISRRCSPGSALIAKIRIG